MPKKPEKMCTSRGVSGSVFVIGSTKDVPFEVCGGLFLKRFINKS